VSGYPAFMERALEAGSTPNGVFGAKVMWGYFDDLVTRLAWASHVRVIGDSLRRGRTPLSTTRRRTLPQVLVRDIRSRRSPPMLVADLMDRQFPGLRYIHISRGDKLRQAVSRWRLRQTGVATVRGDDAPEAAPPRFSFVGIERMRREIIAHEAAWGAFFRECGISPFEVVYEELEREPARVIETVLGDLGVVDAARIQPHPVALRKQSDGLSEEWVERYHSARLGAPHLRRILR
jgi:trehalose 2-sulfotransferase